MNIRKVNVIREQSEFPGIWCPVHQTERPVYFRTRHIRAQRKFHCHLGAGRYITNRLINPCCCPVGPVAEFRLAARVEHIAYEVKRSHVAVVLYRQSYRLVFSQVPFPAKHHSGLPLLGDNVEASVVLRESASSDSLD